MSALQEIIVTGNPLADPPIDVAEQGIDAIRAYFGQ
jgi:hypothetical protein